MADMTPEEILALPMQENDAGVGTVKEYLVALLANLWYEEEGFSGKRPFGNSGWKHDIFETLAANGLIKANWRAGTDGNSYYQGPDDYNKADALITEAIKAL